MNQQAVWKWDPQEPFGVNVPDENPSGLGVFELPLRLPGQYFDKETNLYYNWHRDYDAQSGRYIESDLIGLEGGLNTYGYVGAKPLSFFDYLGLNETPPWLNNNTVVCRAGLCTAALFANGKGVYLTNGLLNNVSVVIAPNGTIPQLACTVPNGKVGFTTVGQIRALGGNVVYTGSFFNPYHGTLRGITPAQAQSLFTPTIRNTFRPAIGGAGGILSLTPFIATPACREGDFSKCFCSLSFGMSGGNPASCSPSFD